jgi:hypothetical protein
VENIVPGKYLEIEVEEPPNQKRPYPQKRKFDKMRPRKER